MKKYKVNNDQLSEEEISKYKDFGKLTQNYHKVTRRPKPLYKRPKLFLGFLLLVIILVLIFQERDAKDKDAENPINTEETE